MAGPMADVDYDDDSIDLGQLLGILLRYKWVLAGLTLGTAALAFLITTAMTPIYRGSATLILEGDAVNVLSIEQIYDPINMQQREYLRTQTEIMRSRNLVERTVERMGLVEDQRVLAAIRDPGLMGSLPVIGQREDPLSADPTQRRRQIINWVRENLTIEPIQNTTLINIHFDSPDRSLSMAVAEGHGNTYIDSGLEARLEVTERAAGWLTERLEGLRTTLIASERELQQFREDNRLVDVSSAEESGGVVAISADRVRDLNRRLVEQQQERVAAENAIALLEDAPQERWSASAAVMRDPAMQELLRARTAAQSRIAELSGRYGPRHPQMISANVELEQISRSIATKANDVVASLRDQIRSARANERDLRQQIEAAEREVQGIQRQTTELSQLQRNVDTNRRLYDMFLQRFQETRQANFQEATARFIELPDEAPQVRPRRTLVTALASMLALMIGLGAVFGREMLNNTLRAIHDVEDQLGLPLLGHIPKEAVKRNAKNAMRTRFTDTEKGAFAEAIRGIRTSVVLSGLDTPHRIITVTSSIPGEGKTTVASNLALAFGQLEKTILLDADMRRPDLAREFNLPMSKGGISNVISGNTTLEEAIHHTEHGIDILTAGIIPPNPLELLSSKRFKAMLDALSKRYERVIIDTAPLNAASDALILSTLSDALIFVAKYESTPMPVIRNNVGSLRQVNAPVIGAVVNAVDASKPDRYGYYSGYYAYGSYSQAEADTGKG
ncbi:MAG: polysaccharide biosynthesis tyrosine autokinase [Gammaproteobacteria bacterium]|nr:polysaccharide biosynthesis tyrosine autokinase [Gammaproteobacteria bacterium]